MRAKKLLIQTIPVAGAITMSACGPARSSNSGGGGLSNDDIFGAWELRSQLFSYDGEETLYEYPSSYTVEGCTTTLSGFMELNEDGTGAFTDAREYSGDCGSYYNGPYAYSYPLSSEAIGDGMIQIRDAAGGILMQCPESPGSSQLECQRTVDGENQIFRFEATLAGNIPEENVPVDGAE